MSATRLKSLAKLTLLIGLPVALVGGLFGAGIYVGEANRVAILTFERDWLGFDVEVPGSPVPVAEAPKTEAPKTEPTPVEPTPVEAPKPEAPKPEAPKPEAPKTEPTPVAETPPAPAPDPALARVTDPPPIALGEPEPLADELRAPFAETVKVRVLVVVDADLHDRRPDWIAYAQRHVAWASQALERQVGVQLELRGVLASPSAWPDREGALAALAGEGEVGVDLVLGLSGRAGSRTPPEAVADDTLARVAVAHANPGSRAPHLRSMLLAIGAAMGAEPATPDDPRWATGSWMADPLARDDLKLTLDEAARRRLIERKHLPFTTAEDPPTQGGE